MSVPEAPNGAPRPLPDRPSQEHLRKEAKRLAKASGVQLASAQRTLAREYGFPNWAALMNAVEAKAPRSERSPLALAAARGDVEAVRALLAQGDDVDGGDGETPLFCVCKSDAPDDQRVAIAQLLLDAGAFVRQGHQGVTALHEAARRGPARLVRLLLSHGALFWQGDRNDKRPLEYAKEATPKDRDEILDLLADKGPRTKDPDFLEAIDAIQRGDVETLAALLDRRPALLHERMIEDHVHPRGYFSDPKLFWVIANNPTLVPRSPDNIVEIAELMLARGVEHEDLNYTLGLVMTNSNFVGTQMLDLTALLVKAGAVVTHGTMMSTLGHWQRAPAAWLVDNGHVEMDASIAAGLGRWNGLANLLNDAPQWMKDDALGMAVINRQYEAAKLCLEAGADPNRFMPCHSHSTPAHQAAIHNSVPMLELLVAHGADLTIEDTMWRGTPLGWSMHEGKREAEAYIRRVQGLPPREEGAG